MFGLITMLTTVNLEIMCILSKWNVNFFWENKIKSSIINIKLILSVSIILKFIWGLKTNFGQKSNVSFVGLFTL